MQTLILKRSFAFVAALFTATLLLLALTTPAHAATATWDGDDGDGNMMTAANWATDTAPSAGDDLVFPAGDYMVTNDFPADTEFNSFTLTGNGSGLVQISGADIDLAAGITNDATYNFAKFSLALNVTLTADQTFMADSYLYVAIPGLDMGANSTLDTGAHTLMLKGDYPVKLGTLSGSGTMEVVSKDFVATGTSFTGSVVLGSGGVLKGTGTVGDVTVNSGGEVAPGLSPGCLTTGDLTFVSGSTFTVEIDGAAECTGYDRTNVTGAVDVTGATLDVQRLSSYDPTAGGAAFVIIDNDAADVVTGTFTGLAEGETATFDGVDYVVSYVGGDGNDVTLTVADVPAAPDTGFGLSTTNYLLVLAFTAFATIGLVFTARKLKKINA